MADISNRYYLVTTTSKYLLISTYSSGRDCPYLWLVSNNQDHDNLFRALTHNHLFDMEPSPLTQQTRPDYFQPKIVQHYQDLFNVRPYMPENSSIKSCLPAQRSCSPLGRLLAGTLFIAARQILFPSGLGAPDCR